MKVLLVAHGYPPELVGGTETAVQNLARGLARRGHDVAVVAGSMAFEDGFRVSHAEDADPVSGETLRVHRIHRADLYFDHWQKSLSARVGEAFVELLRAERPDLVHVNHWIRLTRDLVQHAAREGVPAAVTLHDFWTTCLIAFRVRPDTRDFCDARLGADPCLACAGSVPPFTPWVSTEALHMALAERRADLVRELELARAVVAPSRAHAEAVSGFLGLDAERLALSVVPHGRELEEGGPVPLPLPAEHGRLVLASWGHVHPLKGPDLVVDAVRTLRDPRTARLHFAGGEPDAAFAADVKRAAEGLDVRFHGPFQASELPHHPIAQAHVMVSGTRATESWGLVVDEALALRLPMVLPRAGAFPERLADGEGALFYEPRDARSLGAVLQRLLDEPELLPRLRERLPAVSEKVPSLDEHVDALVRVYEGVVRAGAPEVGAADWWRASLARQTEEEWDASLARRTAAELGFE